MFNGGKVVLRVLGQTEHFKWIRFNSSTTESWFVGGDIDDFVLRFSYKCTLANT